MGAPASFRLPAGITLANVSQFDAGFFVLDDWRARPNVTVSVGLRYEAQTRLSDYRNFAPRLGLAWAVGPKGKAPKTVIRAGGGLFYDRVLSESLSLDSLRRDGIHQQQFIVDNPDFYPAIPSTTQLLGARAPQAIRELDAHMRAPEMAQLGAGAERQLPGNIVLAVNYIHWQAWHSLRSRNITAPLASTPVNTTAIYLYEASGRLKQDQLMTTVNARVSPKLSFSGSYTFEQSREATPMAPAPSLPTPTTCGLSMGARGSTFVIVCNSMG